MSNNRNFAIVGSAALIALFLATGTAAQSGKLYSLRGDVPLTQTGPAPAETKQSTGSGMFGRAYRQQPPLVPHEIDDFEIDLKVNQCLSCHDWPANAEVGAPKISETHYVDRDGVALDHVTPSRWFCTQCHVPQAETQTLIGNDFRSAAEVE